MSLQARLLIPSGYSANDLGALTINISQGHNSFFDFFFSIQSSGEEGLRFLKYNDNFHGLD